jgi:hypothetical protein
MQMLRRADTSLVDDTTSAYINYHDKYVVVYEFAKIGTHTSKTGLGQAYYV